jgi:hypothetical protein
VASVNFAFLPAPAVLSLVWLALGCAVSVVFAAQSRAQPPLWPDEHPVANGCYISTVVYLAKLRAQHPDVTARAETVRLPTGQQHTIAVVEWGTDVYLRDTFMGVTPARQDVQRSFEAAFAAWRATGNRHDYRPRTISSHAERWRDVEAAAEQLAAHCPQIVPVFSSRGPIPVLCWTTPDGELALYEPGTGTAVGLTRRTPHEVATDLFGGRKANDGRASRPTV